MRSLPEAEAKLLAIFFEERTHFLNQQSREIQKRNASSSSGGPDGVVVEETPDYDDDDDDY